MKDSSIQDIFVQIAEGFHKGHTEAVQAKIANLVTSTLVSYNRLVKFLLPIPVKSHYLFNLRDISKVFQGICKSESDLVTDEVAL
jgi:dynein heavy chain